MPSFLTGALIQCNYSFDRDLENTETILLGFELSKVSRKVWPLLIFLSWSAKSSLTVISNLGWTFLEISSRARLARARSRNNIFSSFHFSKCWRQTKQSRPSQDKPEKTERLQNLSFSDRKRQKFAPSWNEMILHFD